MKSALLDLFDLWERQDDGTMSPKQKEANDRAQPWVERLEQLTGNIDEFDAIWGAALRVGEADHPVWFARGFRLGARLMLEVLGEGEVFHR